MSCCSVGSRPPGGNSPAAIRLRRSSAIRWCRPVIAGAVDAWRQAVEDVTAGLPDEAPVDEFNRAWSLLERHRAGALRPLLDDLADLLASAGYTAA